MILETAGIAWRGVSVNRLRSLLTVLGVAIGVASVIILVAVGRGSAIAVERQIESLGTNMLTVFPGGLGFGRPTTGAGGASQTLTMKDVEALQDATLAPDIKLVSPIVSAQVTLTAGGASTTPGQFMGTIASLQEVRSYELQSGRFITDADDDDHERVLVLGITTATNLFGFADPVEQIVRVNGTTFRVVGLLAAKGSNGFQDQDDVAIAPLSTVRDTVAGGTSVSQIVVQAVDQGAVDDAEAEVNAILLGSHQDASGSATFRVLNQGALLQTSADSSETLTVLLAAVAAISLLVGGIGVMNIMLVSVTERTREIGIRKAIGARRLDIVGQFLAEAVILSVVGGAVGVLLGVLGSRFEIVGVTPALQLYAIALSLAVGVGVGLVFGIYPAGRAASLRPIEALRHE